MIYQFPMSLFTCGTTPNWSKLNGELNQISTLIQMCQLDSNYITLSFSGELTGQQLTDVQEAICNHTIIVPPSHDNFFVITPAILSTSSSSWTKISTFKCDITKKINYIEILSYLNGPTTIYDVKIEDSSNSIVAQSLGLSNTSVQVIDLGSITQPTTNICILYLKTTGTVNIDSIIVYI